MFGYMVSQIVPFAQNEPIVHAPISNKYYVALLRDMAFSDLKNVLVGALAGMVSQLPGASGATIAVIFRVYERLVADIADIRGKLLKDLRFVLLFAIGGIIGYVLCAKVLNSFIDEYYVPMLFLFGALILMQVPDIRKMSDDGQPYTKANIIAFLVAFAIVVAIFIIKETYAPGDIDTNWVIMFVAGLIVAASFISPGISGSTMLVVLGIYPAFLDAIDNLDLRLLLPIGIGGLLGLLIFSKIIDRCMTNSRKSTYSAILGLTAGSVAVVFAEAAMNVSGTDAIILSIVCTAAGLILGYGLCRLARIYSDTN